MMTKVLLMVGSAVGDSPEYLIVDSTVAEKIIGPSDSNNWFDPWEKLADSLDDDGEWPEGIKQFESAVEATSYCAENDMEIEEEVDFAIY